MSNQMEKLKAEVRKLVHKHMSGRAMLAEGRRKSSRKSSRHMSGKALLAEGKHRKRRHSSRHMSGHAMLAEGRKRKHSRHMSGKALLAEGKRAKSHKKQPRGNHSALLEINKIARELKRKHPHLEHREAISEASAHYRKMNGSARHSRKHSRRY